MAKKNSAKPVRNGDKALNRSRRHSAEKRSRGGVTVLVLCIVMLISLLSILAGCFAVTELQDGIIMEGVRIAGINVGGMTKEEALSAITPLIKDYRETNMVVTVLGQELELTSDLTEINLNAEAAVEIAYGLGRTGKMSQKKDEQLKAITTGLDADLSECLYVNREAIAAKLNTLEITPSNKLIQPEWKLEGKRPDLSAEEIPTENQTLVITVGTPKFDYQQEDLIDQIVATYHLGKFRVDYHIDVEMPEEIDLDAIYAENYVEPVDAAFGETEDDIIPHSYGYGFNLEEAKLALAEAKAGDTLQFPLTPIAPTQTAGQLSAMLFRDVLASHSAYSASGSDRATNLRLACEALDGIVLMPGERFCYNEALGERTEEKGYRPAPSYVGGETVNTYGGGICQPSSVLYYCVLLSDLEVVERYCHQYISGYMDPGMDATVSWGFPHFRFRNNTDYPIRIDAEANGGNVSIKLVGTDTKDYYVKMEYEILDSYGWSEEVKQIDPKNNPKGYKDGEVITTPYTGYKVNTYKCRYSKADNSLIERVFETQSNYDSRNRVVVKFIKEEEPTQPPPTDPPYVPPTDPPVVPTDPPVVPTDPPIVPDPIVPDPIVPDPVV